MTKAADKKSKVDKQAEHGIFRIVLFGFFDVLRQHGKAIVMAGVVMYCALQVRISITAFAGHTSIATLFWDFAGHLSITVAGSLTVTGVTTALWANEYRRHRKTRERLTKRITMLEQLIDPNRTSSLLTSQGQTSPGDL